MKSWHTRIFHSNRVESTHNDKRDKQTLWRRRRLTTFGFSQIAISTAFIFKVITSQRTGCGNCRKRSRLSVLKWCHIFLFQNLRLKRFAFREITMWQKWRPEIWHAPTVAVSKTFCPMPAEPVAQLATQLWPVRSPVQPSAMMRPTLLGIPKRHSFGMHSGVVPRKL